MTSVNASNILTAYSGSHILGLYPNILSFPTESKWSYYLLGLIALVTVVVIRDLRDPFRNVPGPFWARWTSLWLFLHRRNGDGYIAIHKAHKKYGKLVRIAPDHISINDGDVIPFIYGQGANGLQKSGFYEEFVANDPSMFSATDKAVHSRKRRMLSHAFSFRSLSGLEPFIYNEVVNFSKKMDTFADGQTCLNMYEWFTYLAWDFISDIAFGEPIGFVNQGSDYIEVTTPDGKLYKASAADVVDDREHLATAIGSARWLRFFKRVIPDPFFIRGNKSSIGIAYIARQCVNKRLAGENNRADLLERIIEAHRKETGNEIVTESQIREMTAEAVTFLVAGSHTFGASSTAILYHLRHDERVYKKLLAELFEHFNPGDIPTHEQVKLLPYLQAVITEGLRFHGTNAIGLPRVSPLGGLDILGLHIPEGSEVSIPAWSMGHDDSIWGDAMVFRPERWLENPDLRKYDMAFGQGTRVCVGKHIGNMELLLSLSTFILRYDFDLKYETMDTYERFQLEPVRLDVKFRMRTTKAI